MYYCEQYRTSNRGLLLGQSLQVTAEAAEGVKLRTNSILTLHCRARGLGEEWNKQEVDEVDEGEAIVPEQASCRNTNTHP